MAEALDGLQGHDHHDGGAVGVGDDAARAVEGIGGVALGHHEGHVFVHAESRRVVDHHCTVFRDVGGKFLRSARACGGEGDVYAPEVFRLVAQFLDGVLLAAKFVLPACAALRAEKQEVVYGKLALRKHAQKFLANGAAGTDDCYVHFLLFLSLKIRENIRTETALRVQNYNLIRCFAAFCAVL